MEETNAPQLSEVIFSWNVPEYFRYSRGKWWHVISVAALALAMAWSIIVKNYLLAVFCVLFYLVVIIYNLREPEVVEFVITPDGVKFGRFFYGYDMIDDFFIVYHDQGTRNLYFDFKNPLRGRLVIPLGDQDPIAIRAFLLQFLAEDLDRKGEPISQQIGRWLKF